jgi:hypothetical protein
MIDANSFAVSIITSILVFGRPLDRGLEEAEFRIPSNIFSQRVWKFDEKGKKLESVGILGQPNKEIVAHGVGNEISSDAMDISNEDEAHDRASDAGGAATVAAEPYQIKGVVNDIAIISRGKTGDNETFTVVCAVGKEHRLGRWGSNIKGAKNGALVFEVRKKSRKGGVNNGANAVETAPNAE